MDSFTLHNYVSTQQLPYSSSTAYEGHAYTDAPHHVCKVHNRITSNNTFLQLPVSSLFNLINVYLFLPISRKDVAVCIGMTISVITISATAISEVNHSLLAITSSSIFQYFITSASGEHVAYIGQQLGADIVFHVCVNMIGWYIRYVGDINMRRGFLDKRTCIEQTFRLTYEKEQEVNNIDHDCDIKYCF